MKKFNEKENEETKKKRKTGRNQSKVKFFKCIDLHTPQPDKDIQLKASHTLQVEDKLFDKERKKEDKSLFNDIDSKNQRVKR